MTENKVNVTFEFLLEAVLFLGTAEKHQLWELLDAELFPDDDSQEDAAEIQAARADYQAGNYTTFDEYAAQRTSRSA